MVENAPKPETPIPIVLLANPVTPALRMLSYCIVMLDNLDFSKNEQLESQRKFLVHALMRDQEQLERLLGMGTGGRSENVKRNRGIEFMGAVTEKCVLSSRAREGSRGITNRPGDCAPNISGN